MQPNKIENERHFYDPMITHLQHMLFIRFLFKQIECSEVRTKNTQIKPKIPQKSNKDPPRIIPPCSRIQRDMHTNIHKEDIFCLLKKRRYFLICEVRISVYQCHDEIF